MRKPVLVQGLGCVETGAQLVLRDLIAETPTDLLVWVLCTKETAKLLSASPDQRRPNIRVIGLSHCIWGRWLRVLIEFVIGLASAFGLFARLINLSHYGLCFGGQYVLYMHSPSMMDVNALGGLSDGRPNKIKRWMLNSCIRRAALLVLQTKGMECQLLAYCENSRLSKPTYQVVRPIIKLPEINASKRKFEFQLFYPTSRFAHKRVDLATNSGALAHKQSVEIGLVVTSEPKLNEGVAGVLMLGRISRDEVYGWFAGSDALLFTSERETLGLPLLEAMEFGLPVIAPRLPYAEELLGEAGCYFDNPCPDAVARAIIACRLDYDSWRSKIRRQATYIRNNSATWAQHWEIFLKV